MEKRKWEKLSYKNTLKRIEAMRSQKKKVEENCDTGMVVGIW